MNEWRDLHVGDVLGLLESPQEEVVEEVRQLLKETLATVRDPWLVTGLLDYFFATNSGRLLDLLLGVREPHDRHLLDRVHEGLKGNDRFRYSCLLLYAVRRQPPPMWLRKLLQHGAMKELLHILHTEDDLPVLVSGLMVVVVLMPLLPLEIGHAYLNPILEVFSRLVKWAPRPDDSQVVLIPYLQVAVYSLFHRLYAFWPCHFMPFLHDNFSSHDSQGVFITTLKPMLERVRLHPLLVTGTTQSELSRSRWIGLEPHQLIHECAKLCLDPIEATCEDGGGSWFNVVNVTSTSGSFEISSNDIVTMPNSWMLNAVENSFWSPSLAKSPAPQMTSRSNTSVPNTPVYPILTPTQPSVRQVAESPPEAAIEATPETTPFTSPVKMDQSTTTSRRSGAIRALSLNIDLNTTQKDSNSTHSPMSPVKKEPGAPFKFPDSQGRDIFSQVSKSHLLTSKLQQIQRDRQQSYKENLHLTLLEKGDGDNKGKDEIDKESKDSKDSTTRRALGERPHNIERSNSLQEVPTQEKYIKGIPLGGQTATDMRSRRRKISVFDGNHFSSNEAPDLSLVNINGNKDMSLVPSSKSTSVENGSNTSKDGYESLQIIDRRISEEKEYNASVNGDSRRSSGNSKGCDERRLSDENQIEGLGIPSQRSMSDLVKNMRSMRLRYFSQCGPPPDLSHINTRCSQTAISPTKMVSTPVQLKKRSSSCPDLASVESDPSSMTSSLISRRVRKESTLSSLTLSPTRQAILLSEASTQTEESNVVNPYEQLLEALSLGPGILKTNNNTMQTNQTYDQTDSKGSTSSKSPHELLDQYVTLSAETKGSGKLGWSQQNANTGNAQTNNEKVLKKQVGLMHTMLMIERYKREVHAERNRRLLGRAKKVYALEEHQKGLKEEV
ncbi:unnamed protein product, partial [Meganyctiphanes norvegica]